MNAIVRAGAIALAAAATACLYTSRSPARDPAASSPLGAFGEIAVGNDRYAGELLAVTGVDFVLLTSRRLVVIPFAVAGVGSFSSIGVGTYGAPWRDSANQLRYASRFPYGIPPAALDAILETRGQAAPDTIRAAR